MIREQLIMDIENETISLGFTLIKSLSQLDQFFSQRDKKKTLVLVNSLCKCAGSKARAIVSKVLVRVSKDKIFPISIFAGVDNDIAGYFFRYTKPYPPSSPSIAVFEDSELLFFIERHEIQFGDIDEIIGNMIQVLK